jgi:hypothetical protein
LNGTCADAAIGIVIAKPKTVAPNIVLTIASLPL